MNNKSRFDVGLQENGEGKAVANQPKHRFKERGFTVILSKLLGM